MSKKKFEYDPSINHFTDTETNKEYCEYNIDKICDLLNEYDDNLRMCHEKTLYWRNKAENIFGDMKTNVELQQENIRLKKEKENLEQDREIRQLKEDISLILGYVTVQQEMYPLSKKQYDAKKRLREYVLYDVLNGDV